MGKWTPPGFVPDTSQAFVPEGFIPDTSFAPPPGVASPGDIGGARANTLRWLRATPYITGAIGGTIAGTPGATVGGMAGKVAEQSIGGTLPQSPKEAVDTIGGAGVLQGALQLPAEGLAWLGGKVAPGIAGWLRGRNADAAERGVRTAYAAERPFVEQRTGIEQEAQQAAQAATRAARRAKTETGLSVGEQAGAAVRQTRAGGVRSAVERGGQTRQTLAGVARQSRDLAQQAGDITGDVAAGRQATQATRKAATQQSQELIQTEPNDAPATIYDIADHVIAATERRLGRTLTPGQRAQMVGQVHDRFTEVMPEFSHGMVTGKQLEYGLPELDVARKAFQQSAKPEINAMNRGVRPAPDLDKDIADALVSTLENRVGGLGEARAAESAAIKDVQGVKALENTQPTPTVAAIKGARTQRVNQVRDTAASEALRIRNEAASQGAEQSISLADQIAAIQDAARRGSADARAAIEDALAERLTRLRTETAAQTDALDLPQKIAVARAMAMDPHGPIGTFGLHGVTVTNHALPWLLEGAGGVAANPMVAGTASNLARGAAFLAEPPPQQPAPPDTLDQPRRLGWLTGPRAADAAETTRKDANNRKGGRTR